MATFTPGAYRVRADWNFIAQYDLHKPDVDPTLVKKYGNQLLTELFGATGKKVPTSSIEYIHHEEDRIMPKVKATTAGAAAGATATFTIALTSPVQNISLPQASPYAGSTLTNQGVPVRLNDLILIKPSSGTVSASTYIRAFVDAVNVTAGTFTATPLDSADAIPAIASADEIFIYGNAFGEGSGQPEGRNSRTIKYTNNLQIIKDSFKITNTEKNAVLWVEVVDEKTGQKGYYWRLKGEGDTYERFLNYREMTSVLGEQLNNTAISNAQASAGTPMKMTEGLIPTILSQGTATNYSSVTGWTLADGESMVKQMDKEKAPMENWMFTGINLSLDIDREMRSNLQNGAISYGSFSGDQAKAIDFGFDSFKIGNYTFHKKEYRAFNDAQTFGAVGYTFANEAFIIPALKKMSDDGQLIDSVRMRYLQSPSESREIRTTPRDMLKIDGQDVFIVDYICEIGFEGMAMNRSHYIKRA